MRTHHSTYQVVRDYGLVYARSVNERTVMVSPDPGEERSGPGHDGDGDRLRLFDPDAAGPDVPEFRTSLIVSVTPADSAALLGRVAAWSGKQVQVSDVMSS